MRFVHNLLHSDINPSNCKSRTLPLLNIGDNYGRTFHLSWIGFFVAFLSWFAFPPLIHSIIQKDLQLTQAQVANSNIIALIATLLVRLIVGPLCDKYGPRYVMVGCLLAGAIPIAFVPLIKNATGLILIRFFIGILGGTFVPCQVWTSQFFDKNIVGFANALAAGWGNAGGGLTFFLMPAIVSSLINNYHISEYWAWRLAFPICPLTIILCISVITLIFGHDTPNGSWRDRHGNKSEINDDGTERMKITGIVSMVNEEIPRAPTLRDVIKITLSLQTVLVALPYLCSFGSELAIESIISNLYIQTAKIKDGVTWNDTTAGYWAAAFGLLNIFTRPLGGYISDVLYRYKGLMAKKWWLIFLGIINGLFLISIGLTNLHMYPLIGLMTGAAVFLEAANGAIFGLVPAIHPHFNGVVSGISGASGNIGGVLFSLVFRLLGTNYFKALWIIGVVCSCSNLAVAFIPLKKTERLYRHNQF